MSIEEIQAAVSDLSLEELRQVEGAILQAYRRRGNGIIYDDAHGVLTDEELLVSADTAFLELEQREEKNAEAP